jgi:hypothetical protein
VTGAVGAVTLLLDDPEPRVTEPNALAGAATKTRFETTMSVLMSTESNLLVARMIVQNYQT